LKETESKKALCQKSNRHQQYYQRESIEAFKQLIRFSTREQKLRRESTLTPGEETERKKKATKQYIRYPVVITNTNK